MKSQEKKGKLRKLKSVFGIIAFLTLSCIFIYSTGLYVIPYTIIIIFIFFLEGLQISVAELKWKELWEWKDKMKRAYKIHEKFKRNDEEIQKFFAGRQLLIVVLMFIASQLTSLSVGNLVVYGYEIPSYVSSIFFNILGAFVVFWCGSLSAQILATKYRVEFLNLPLMNLLYDFCILISKVKLPRPSYLVAQVIERILFMETEPIPIEVSAVEGYEYEKRVRGYGIESMKLTLDFEDINNVRMTHEYEIEVEQKIEKILIDYTLPQGAVNKQITLDINGKSHNDRIKHIKEEAFEYRTFRYIIYRYKILPPVGTLFKKSDKISFKSHASVKTPTPLIQYIFRITHPTYLLNVSFSFSEMIKQSYSIRPLTISVNYPDGSTKNEIIELLTKENRLIAEYKDYYPPTGAEYVVKLNYS